MAHVNENIAKSARNMGHWFVEEETKMGTNAHWSEDVVVNFGNKTYTVEFEEFPVNIPEFAKVRSGYIPKYLKRIIGAYLIARYPNMLTWSEEDRAAFGAALAKGLGINNATATEGRFKWAGNWMDTAHKQVQKALGIQA